MRYVVLLACLVAYPIQNSPAQNTVQNKETVVFTHADTLLGSLTPQRTWWDVTFYDLHVSVHPADSSFSGYNGITYRVLKTAQEMQVDLMMPLQIDSVIQDKRQLTYRRDGNAFFITMSAAQNIGTEKTVTVYYHGKPHIAKNPPWDGGVVWKHDHLGHAWIATACQEIGSSVWWPSKDTQADEPDSQRIAITVPDSLMDISNGRLRSTTQNQNGTTTYEWFVQDPINNYDVAINAGTYAHFSDSYDGEQGTLTMDFWPLAYNLDKAKPQFAQAKSMLTCFEHWFGPYPWYKDGYKLVEAPYLGMEHQSAVAYGNHYSNGYLGQDLSHTGWGMRWDFIVIHESGHEWFGNNITSQDVADMWVHEGFTNYSEGLYTECQYGKAAGAAYIIGLRHNVRNDEPIISHYGVHKEGSGDMYYKAANMLHTIRQIINNDSTWRDILRGLNKTFWHQIVTGEQIQRYINTQSGINFNKVFQQYLTTTKIPVLEYRLSDSTLSYRWTGVVPGFDMPVRVTLTPDKYDLIYPTEAWKTITAHLPDSSNFHIDEDFYVGVKKGG